MSAELRQIYANEVQELQAENAALKDRLQRRLDPNEAALFGEMEKVANDALAEVAALKAETASLASELAGAVLACAEMKARVDDTREALNGLLYECRRVWDHDIDNEEVLSRAEAALARLAPEDKR